MTERRRLPSPWTVLRGSLASLFLVSTPCLAQTTAQTRPPEEQPTTPGAPSTTAAEPATAEPPSIVDPDHAAARFKRIDALKPQGQTTDVPGLANSILGDEGGWRTRLADRGLFVRFTNITTVTANVLDDGGPSRPQLYSGQKPTISSPFEARGSIRLYQSGEDMTQLNAAFRAGYANWAPAGKTGAEFFRLDLYSTFLDRKVEVTAGYGVNTLNFVGIFAGGNLVLAGGLAGTIPVQVGLSSTTAPTPLLNVQVNGDDGFYLKSGIQRSLLPAGLLAEATGNGIGLQLTRRGAKPLLIQEIGVLRPASPGGRQMWLRAGMIYNTSNYTRFDGRGTGDNYAFYALADYQVFKPSTTEPYRGVYLGATLQAARQVVNVFGLNAEARAYAIGMVPGRPTDSATITVSYNDFTDVARRSVIALGQLAQREQLSISALYAANLSPGVFLAPNVTYIKNPSFTGDFKPALNLAVTLTTVF